MLLGRLRALQARGGSLSVKHMQPPVEKLFRLSGLDRVIGVEDDIREVGCDAKSNGTYLFRAAAE